MITVLVLLILKSGAVSVGGSVTFENPNTCALKGSSVELGCSYTYPDEETVKTTAWFKGVFKNDTWRRVELSELPSYQNRSEYVGDLQHNCGLALHDLQINDTGHYYFRFDTAHYGRRSKTSVHLTVTELSARVYPDRVRAGDKVTLECRTSCQLSNIVWFKDGHPVTKPEFEAKAEDTGSYVCASEGQESVMSDPVSLDVQYPPLNVSVEMSYSGNLTVGTSVNLTCHSAANPAADSYTWYRGTAPSFSSTLYVGSGQVLFIPSAEASHTGLYLCQARNTLGGNNSTEVLLSPLSEVVTLGDSDSEHAGAMSAGGSVTFENPNTCALKGSSVELGCSYTYPDEETVKTTAWFKGVLKNDTWKRVELSELPSYQNRSEYVGDLQHNCGLALHDLQINDTGHYYFRFDTARYGRRSKTPVHLTVTELSARVYPDRVRAGDKVTLECRTSCQLSNIVWFKDGHPVTEPEFEAKAEDTGSYVCAFEGQESVMSDPVSLDVQYPPLNVSVEMNYSGNLTVGSSVNLTCHSAANPAADSYTWYRGTAPSFSSTLYVGSGQVLFIPSAEASHTGLYLCQARNTLGGSNSTEVLLSPLSEVVTVGDSDGNHVIFFVSTALKVFITMLLTVVMILTWKKRNNVVHKKESSNEYEYIAMT